MIAWGSKADAIEHWRFEFNDQGNLQLRNRNSGLCAGIREGSRRPGKDGIQWTISDYPLRLEHATGKFVRIFVRNSDLCFDTSGEPIIQSIPGSSETQFWSLEPAPQ